MRRLTIIAAALAALALPLPAFAQQEATDAAPTAHDDTSSDVIVVQGYKRKDVAQHVWRVIDVDSDQLARREGPFCPRVVNFPPDYTDILEKLIRRNAEKAGVEVETQPCLANAFAVFARDPQDFMQSVYKAHPIVMQSLNSPERRRLVKGDTDVYSWSLKVTKDRYGGTLLGDPPSYNGFDISRLTTNVRHDILATYVVMDIDRTAGMTLQQLADFITLHMLIDFRQDAAQNSAPDSILHLFEYDDPQDAPQEMSPMDAALIEAIYAQVRNDRTARVQRGHITDYIMAKLKKEGLSAAK